MWMVWEDVDYARAKGWSNLYNENYDAWDFVKLTSNDSEKEFTVGGRWNSERLKTELTQYYTLVGHLEELDIESYLEEKKVKW